MSGLRIWSGVGGGWGVGAGWGFRAYGFGFSFGVWGQSLGFRVYKGLGFGAGVWGYTLNTKPLEGSLVPTKSERQRWKKHPTP